METLRIGGGCRLPAAPRYSIHRACRHRVARTELGYHRKILIPRAVVQIPQGLLGHLDFIPEVETQETLVDPDDESDAVLQSSSLKS
jgi:hypothetical protein